MFVKINIECQLGACFRACEGHAWAPMSTSLFELLVATGSAECSGTAFRFPAQASCFQHKLASIPLCNAMLHSCHYTLPAGPKRLRWIELERKERKISLLWWCIYTACVYGPVRVSFSTYKPTFFSSSPDSQFTVGSDGRTRMMMMMHSYALKLAYSLACLLTYLLIALPYRKTSSKFKVSLSLGRKILFLLIEALKKYASMSRNWRIRTQWGRVLSYKSPHSSLL